MVIEVLKRVQDAVYLYWEMMDPLLELEEVEKVVVLEGVRERMG
jgi:hypothetical protein